MGRARRRCLRACRQKEARNDDSLEAGNVPPEPSDDEAMPAEPKGIQLTLPPHFNPMLGSQDPRLTVQMLLRPIGGISDTLPSKDRRTSRNLDETSVGICLADFGIPPRGIKLFAWMEIWKIVNAPLNFRHWDGRALITFMRIMRGSIPPVSASIRNRFLTLNRPRPMNANGEWALSPSPYVMMERRVSFR